MACHLATRPPCLFITMALPPGAGLTMQKIRSRLPVIGTLDSSRTLVVMESLLSRIEADRAKVVVIDVTGVLAIDSQVSHHLIQMIRAIGLMGAEAILTGIRPEIARALTNLNIDLGDVITRSSLSEGLKEAFLRLNIEAVSQPRGVPAS